VKALLNVLPVGRLRYVALPGRSDKVRMASQGTPLLIQARVFGNPADGLQQMDQDLGLGRSRLPDLVDRRVENAVIGRNLTIHSHPT
jgi:hypothetical protein